MQNSMNTTRPILTVGPAKIGVVAPRRDRVAFRHGSRSPQVVTFGVVVERP